MEADRWVSGEKTCKEEVAMTERSLENKDEETRRRGDDDDDDDDKDDRREERNQEMTRGRERKSHSSFQTPVDEKC